MAAQNQQELAQEIGKALAQLKDIHYPDAPVIWPLSDILWWPPAPGVIVLLIMLAILIVYLSMKIFSKIKKYYINRKIKIALRELILIEKNLRSDNFTTSVQQISILLKRCAMIKYRAYKIQSLSGKKWLKFLNNTGKTNEFTNSPGLLMTTIPYINKVAYDINLEREIKELIMISKRWIKRNL